MKKGFVVYFDNCVQTAALPDATYAAVWRAVFRYAQLLAEGGDAEGFLQERLAALPAEGAMALRFLSDNARRDHGRYRSRTEQYRAAQDRGGGYRKADKKGRSGSDWITDEEMRELIQKDPKLYGF